MLCSSTTHVKLANFTAEVCQLEQNGADTSSFRTTGLERKEGGVQFLECGFGAGFNRCLCFDLEGRRWSIFHAEVTVLFPNGCGP